MQLGHPGDQAIRRIIRPPEGVDITLWLSPSECTWDYIPEEPYRIVRGSIANGEGMHFFAWEDDLSEERMYSSFVTRHLPRAMQWTSVTDVHLQIVLAWAHYGDATLWGGCDHTFGLLAVAHNPIDAGVWEQLAKAQYEARHTMEGQTWIPNE